MVRQGALGYVDLCAVRTKQNQLILSRDMCGLPEMALKNYFAQLFCPSFLPHLSPNAAPGQYPRFELYLCDTFEKQILVMCGTDAQM